MESAKQPNTGTSASQIAQQMYLNSYESRCLCVRHTLYLLDSKHCNPAKQPNVETSADQAAKQMGTDLNKQMYLCAVCTVFA